MRFKILSMPSKVKFLVAGLPDMGNVAGIVMDHLITKLNMVIFAEARDEWPPYVRHESSRVHFERGWFRVYFRDGLKFIAMNGTHQPVESTSLYNLCESVIDLSLNLNIERVITVGAAHTTDDEIEEPRVFYATTSDPLGEEIEGYGAVKLESEGFITGYNGLLLGIAKERGINGICLLGEINDPGVKQYHAAKAVLQVLSHFIGEEINLEELDEEIEKIKAMKKLGRMLRRRDRPPGVM
ncbi:MAG: PAC2 family protein [Aigarchaeota archaeon]|nr:PAC2 family protein [Aigarchaeota archaeon]MDW8092144.1 PAC2 family protein [Nitrososphaerota archaeon]